MAHIWACPPSEGDDYIFHCHPDDQKIPKPKRLQEWYKKMLDKGIIERIVLDYKDILKQAMEDKLMSAAELPYFEGDFWPNVLEESIKELDQEEEEKRRQAEAAEAASVANNVYSNEGEGEAEVDGKKRISKKDSKKKTNKKANMRKSCTKIKPNTPQLGNDLSAKIYATMEKHKEVFFVIRLHSAQSAASLAPIQDPDPFIACDLMDGRDAFLTMARERHYEFSSLRRAKFSTMAMLYELHTQSQDKFVYTCNNCKNNVETRYHCTTCDDFDLCVPCFEKNGHEHKMEKLGLDLDDGTIQSDQKQVNPQESRKMSIQRCIQSLVHACQCRDANCRLPSCQRMKRVVTHTKACKMKMNGNCPICKQLIALCFYHSKYCNDSKCAVPICSSIKHKMKQQQLQQRLQQAQLLRRRMAVMNNSRAGPSGNGGTSGSGAVSPGSSSGGSNSNSNSVSSSSQNTTPQQHSPHTTSGMGVKPGSLTPSPNVLQALKQVQEEAARQQAPHGHAGIGYPSVPPQVMASPQMQRNMSQIGASGLSQVPHPPNNIASDQWKARYTSSIVLQQQNASHRQPNAHLLQGGPPNQSPGAQPPNAPSLMSQQSPQQVQQQQQQLVSGSFLNQSPTGNQSPNINVLQSQNSPGVSGSPRPQSIHQRQALQQLLQTLKSPHSPQQQDQILQILKTNPQLMAAFIKQRQNHHQQQQAAQQQQAQHQQAQQQQQQQQIISNMQHSASVVSQQQQSATLQHMQNVQQQNQQQQNWYQQQQQQQAQQSQHNQIVSMQPGFASANYNPSQQRLPTVRGGYGQPPGFPTVDQNQYNLIHGAQQQQNPNDLKPAPPPFPSPQGMMGPPSNMGNPGLSVQQQQ